MVTICTTSLTFSNSTFCPHSVFMCFVWISEQTSIISLYNINWLVFITEIQCVYCAVRTGYLYIIHVNYHPWPRLLVHGLSPEKLGFDPSLLHLIVVLNTVTLGQGFFPILLFYTVNIIPPVLHTHFHLQAVITRRTNGWSLGTFHKAVLFGKLRSIG